mmetsp:Transcript_73417/g.160806  ORF Transcript_73417/g.160806 Transcript_73417/m.160806 type:complete len:88 (+) Transcript_73417:332-595(+)
MGKSASIERRTWEMAASQKANWSLQSSNRSLPLSSNETGRLASLSVSGCTLGFDGKANPNDLLIMGGAAPETHQGQPTPQQLPLQAR